MLKTVTKTALAAMLVAGASGLSGCGAWFGEEDIILEGERIAIRRAKTGQQPTGGRADIPQARPVGDWPQVGGSAQRSLGNISGSAGLQRIWSASIGAGSDSESRVTASPVVKGGRIYALDAASQVTALTTGGEQVWRVDLTPEDEDGRDGFGGGVAIAGDMLIATTGFGQVVALSAANGEKRWSFQATAPIRSAPAVSNGRVVVNTRDGAVIGLDAASGSEIWRVLGMSGGGAGMIGGGGSAPAISGEVIAAPFSSGDIGVIRLSDGRRGWSEPIGGAVRGSGITVVSDVTSAPVMSGGRIFAGGVSGRFVAFDIAGRHRIWSRDIGVYNPAWVAGENLFVVTADARLLALSGGAGRIIWETALPRYKDPEDRKGLIAYGGPIMVGGKLILVSSDEKIMAFDAGTGAQERIAELPAPSAIPPISAGGVVYVVTSDGELHAYK